MKTLPQAIQDAIAFVRSRPDAMTREEVDEFRGLAETVYVLAFRAGLADALPQPVHLEPQLVGDELPPVQYESKLNLPGDWDREPTGADDDVLDIPTIDFEDGAAVAPVFLPCATPRWFQDMATLARLVGILSETPTAPPAEPKRKRRGRPKTGEGDKEMMVMHALAHYHGYEPGGHVANPEPIKAKALASVRRKKRSGLFFPKDSWEILLEDANHFVRGA